MHHNACPQAHNKEMNTLLKGNNDDDDNYNNNDDKGNTKGTEL